MDFPAAIKRRIPPRIKDTLNVLFGRIDIDIGYTIPASPTQKCPVCERRRVRFKPCLLDGYRELDRNRYIHSFTQWETCNLEHCACNHCGAFDRDRLYALYLRSVSSGDTSPRRKVLHIAPSPALNAFLKRQPDLDVRTAELFMKGVDDAVDLTDMRMYEDGQYDIFICSHVLEHVNDDIKAMSELYRVLKASGFGIAMVPIDLNLRDIYENPAITDEDGRCKHFGQRDHVRLYSKTGFVSRLESVGFRVKQLGIEHFGAALFADAGIHPRSVIYVVAK